MNPEQPPQLKGDKFLTKTKNNLLAKVTHQESDDGSDSIM